MTAVTKPAFAHKLPATEPNMRLLCDLYDHADKNWTPETDDLALDLADMIKRRIIADYGLTEGQRDALSRALS